MESLPFNLPGTGFLFVFFLVFVTIEFPAVLLNTSTGETESEFHTYVQPQEHPVLSEFCTELTGLTQNQVDEGVPLNICLSQFLKLIQKIHKEKKIMFSTDILKWDFGVCLQYECKRKQPRKPDTLNSWIDLKAACRAYYNRKPKGLNGALQDLGIAFAGREHSRKYDMMILIFNILPSPPLTHVPKHHIYRSFKHLQGWGLNHFPGQPVPMLDNPLAVSCCFMACYLGEETDPHLATTSFQVAVESNKVSPQPPLLQAKQPQFPQPPPIRLVLQTLHQLRCPSLDTLQHLNVSLGVRGPKLNTGFEVRPHQCRVQGHNHCPSSPAGHAISDTSQGAIGRLGHLVTLLAHIQAAVNHQHSQVLFCWAAFQPLFPKPVALHGVAVTQVQDLALGLVKPHTIDLGPSIQPVQVPLQSLPTLKQINTPTQLGVVCKLTEAWNTDERTLTINFTDKTPLGSNSRPETSRDGTCETNSLDEKNHHGIAGIKINSNVQTEEQQTTCTDSSADVHAVPSSSSRTELHAQAQSSLAASTDKFLVPLEQAQQSHSTVSTGIRQGLSNGQPLSTARYSPPVHGSGLVLVSTTISSVNISNEDISTSSDCLSLLTDGEGVALIPESQYEQNSECDKFKDDSSTDILTVFEEKTISKQLAVMRSDNQSLEETVVPVEPLKSIIYKSPDTTIYNVGTVQRQTSNFSAFKLPSAMVNAISALSALAGNCSAPSEVPKRKPASPKTFPPAKKQSFAICQEKTTSFDHSLSLRSSNLSKASPAILNFTVNLNQSVRAVKNGKPTPPLSNCGRRAKKAHEGNKKGCGYFKWEYALLKEKSNGLTLNADALTSLGTYATQLDSLDVNNVIALPL
ncbi:LOW QUALITY PROTEIN: hypothetical protein QYF61_011953, partial [Mycteria americana]